MSQCQEWQGRFYNHGYGYRYWRGEEWLAHRAAWVEANGPIPTGVHVLHKCNNKKCINTEHLYLGNEQDNYQDKVAAGFRRSWDLTEAQKQQIRELKGKATQQEIAKIVGCSQSIVSRYT